MLEKGEPEEENCSNGKAESSPPPNPELDVFGCCWSSLLEPCLLEPVINVPDGMCWARKEANNGISTPVCNLDGVLAGESPADPGAGDGAKVCNFFIRLEGSFRDPKNETGGLKRVCGRCGWCVSAMATEVVAAAACRGAWIRGAQMTGVGDGGVWGGTFCIKWAQWAMSRSCCTICWMISFSW